MQIQTTVTFTFTTTWEMEIEPMVGTIFWRSPYHPSMIYLTPYWENDPGISVGPCHPNGDHVEIPTMSIPCHETLTPEFWKEEYLKEDFKHPQWQEYFKIVESTLPQIVKEFTLILST